MKQGRISQTALKVALGLITLSIKGDWAKRLPAGLVEASEHLLLASKSPGYGPGLIRASKKKWMIRIYELQDRLMAGQWEGFGHRKIFMQQQAENAISKGARQVVVLGAGFDTLCLRLAPLHSDIQFFEIDHPATSAAKARGVTSIAGGQPPNMTMIAVDLGEHTLSKVLAENDRWDSSQPSVILAEGLLQYLTDEEVGGLFREAAACTAPGSRIAFTHTPPDPRRVIPTILRLIGEPFRSAVRSEDLPDYIEGTGWAIISDVDTDPAHGIERYAVAERS